MYERLGNQEIFQLGPHTTHPMLVLHKCSPLVDHHQQLLQTFKTHPRLEDVWTVLTFNGEGV